MTDGWLSFKILLQPSAPTSTSFQNWTPLFSEDFHCLWLLLDSFFLLLTFLPHKILWFFGVWPTLLLIFLEPSTFAKFETEFSISPEIAIDIKVASFEISCNSSSKDLFQFVLLECHSILVVYIASSEGTFAHFTKMCIKKGKQLVAERRERKVSFLPSSDTQWSKCFDFSFFLIIQFMKVGVLARF